MASEPLSLADPLLSNTNSNKVLRVAMVSSRQQVLDRPDETVDPYGRVDRWLQLRGAANRLGRLLLTAAGVVTS